MTAPAPAVLFLLPALPWPPAKGTAMRNLALLSATAASGARVRALAFGEEGEAAAWIRDHVCPVTVIPTPRRGPFGRSAHLVFSRLPDLARRLASPAWDKALAQELEEYPPDLVQVEGLELGRSVSFIRKRRPDARILLDEHNCEHQLQSDLETLARTRKDVPGAVYSGVQARRLRTWEPRIANAATHVLTVSAEDRDALRAVGTRAPITVLPNGVEAALWDPTDRAPGDHVLFAGTMDYRPNVDAAVWAARDLVPLLPDGLRLTIAGRDPAPVVLAQAGPRVEVTGTVDSLAPWYRTARAAIMPLRAGSGSRLKALEAMAAGVPVVATATAMRGLEAEAGIHYLAAETGPAFALAIARLLDEPGLEARLTAAALELVRQKYDWPVLTRTLLAVQGSLLRAPTP